MPRQARLLNVPGSMADLGQKHTCFKCSSKFYDLKKAKALCPKCGADQVDAPAVVAPPPPPPAKRGPKMVDPIVEEVAEEAAATDDDADVVEDAELDVDGDDDTSAVEEDADEPAGNDSYE